jgi:DNA helicase II / ATP-dependent DNA helicase PcrA
MESPLLAGLNPQQREAVSHESGPLLIFAGAGSGKTNVLTRRIAYLIREREVRPYNILGVTFTNKAAGEMKQRIASLIGDLGAREVWAGTFHSVCARILRERGKDIGLVSSFAIYDDADQMQIVRECLKEHDYDEKQYHPRAILGQISKAKESLITPQEMLDSDFSSPFDRAVGVIYKMYQERLTQANALDFDDLIMRTVQLLQQSQTAREHYQRRFQYVHCDEFQDTNESQYKLLALLSGQHKNLCVVGDDDQSIYAFRGANVQIILNFERDFPGATVIKLEQNYRSTKNILEAAYHVVRNNKSRADKRLWTENDEGDHLTLLEAPNEVEEAIAIATIIRDTSRDSERSLRDYAVLYRTNAQSRALEEQFLNQRIPYRIVGGVRFYERREVKDVLAYLRVALNPHDSISLRRIINVPARNIGLATAEKIKHLAAREGILYWEALQRCHEADLGARARASILGFVKLVEYLRKQSTAKPVSDFIQDVLDTTSYLIELMKEGGSHEAEARKENVEELISVAKAFEALPDEESDHTLAAFLENVALVSDIDSLDPDADAVTMMTLHSAKGLEFPVVFLAGLEEGIFPHIRSMGKREEMDEERRLCYVGITRAKKQLYMSFADSRMIFGNVSRNPVSRFVREIPMSLFIAKSARPASPPIYAVNFSAGNGLPSRPLSETTPRWNDYAGHSSSKGGVATAPAAEFKLGEKVKHATFGPGTVVSMNSNNGDTQVTVAFAQPHGIKKLMASFAKLERGSD